MQEVGFELEPDTDASPGQIDDFIKRRRARRDAAGLGRSRGGLSSKIHAAVDAAGLPLSFVPTPGQAADRAYSSRANRAYLRRRHISAVIPEKTDQQANRKKKGWAGGRPVTYDPARCKQRNTVERCFQKVKTWRGLATRYGKSPDSYKAGLHLRGSIMWQKLLTSNVPAFGEDDRSGWLPMPARSEPEVGPEVPVFACLRCRGTGLAPPSATWRSTLGRRHRDRDWAGWSGRMPPGTATPATAYPPTNFEPP